MAVPTTLVIDATQETLEITNSRDATALRGYSIEAGPPTDGEGLFFQASSSEYVFRTVDETIDDRVAALIQDSAAGGLTWTYDDSAATLTPAYVGDSTLVTTGALNSGSITSGFTSIDVGAGAITTTGTVAGGVLAGTLSTAAQGNVTSLGTLTALQVDNININLNTISSTAGTDLNITPLSGQQIVLDGAIIIDAGVVTGATSIASTAFAGDLTGDVTGNADTATALETARTIGGTSFDGTASIVPATITVADTTDTTSYVALFESATGDLAPKSDAGVTYNAGTGILTATGFAGPLTGNVTGNVTGSSGSTTGNAATATALETARTIGGTSFDGTANIAVALAATATALASARTIGGVSFDGTGNIVPGTITVADTTDTTSYVALFESATGDLGPKTDAGITYNAGTGLLTATGFSGPLTGNVTGDCSGSSGSTTGNAATATLASTVTVADSSDTTAFPAFFDSATGSLAIMTDASNLTYNASTGVLTATGFAGPLTGNVTGDVSGSSGSTTGNAATATALQTARTIGGTSFDGTGNIVPATITVADTTDTTSYVALFESATGDLGPKSDAGITYNAGTGTLASTAFSGPLTGNVTGNVSGSAASLSATLAVASGGTNITSYTSGDILYASGTTTLAKLAKGSDTEVLTLASGVPSWSAPGAAAAGSLTGTELNSTVVTSSLTSTGALNGGSITSGFGAINNGASDITTTGTVSATTLAGTLSTVAQGNITSLGTLTSLGVGAITSTGDLSVTGTSDGSDVATFTGKAISTTANLSIWERSGGAVAAEMKYVDGSTDMELGTSTAHAFSLKTGDTRALSISSSQDVNIPNGGLAIGTTSSPAMPLDVRGALASNDTETVARIQAGGTTQAGGITVNCRYGANAAARTTDIFSVDGQSQACDLALGSGSTVRMTIASDGKVGIGADMNKEVNFANGPNGLENVLHFEAITDSRWSIYAYDRAGSGGYRDISFGAAKVFIQGSDGFVGINDTSPSYQLEVNGTCHVAGVFTATTKTFKIDHPLPEKKDTHHLTYSCIEGPQADLIWRGTVDLSGGYAQVDLDDAAGMTEGTFEVLCRDVQCFIQNDSGWSSVRGAVEGNTLTIECEATDSDDTVSWMVVAERCDPGYLASTIVDDEGRFIVEPEKPEEG